MPHACQLYTKIKAWNSFSFGGLSTQVVSLNGTWKEDSISFTVDPLYRYTVHVRNSASFGTTSINIDFIEVYGEASASYLTCSEDSGGYRFGFNSMSKDNEIYGEGNAYTTDFRELDTRICRWWGVDPVVHSYQSPYCAFDNNPIFFTDPSGAATEGDYYGKDGKWIGKDEHDDDKVYVVDNASDVKYKENGLIDKLGTTNKEELKITHTQFKMLAGLASKEDYSNKDAIFATANA